MKTTMIVRISLVRFMGRASVLHRGSSPTVREGVASTAYSPAMARRPPLRSGYCPDFLVNCLRLKPADSNLVPSCLPDCCKVGAISAKSETEQTGPPLSQVARTRSENKRMKLFGVLLLCCGRSRSSRPEPIKNHTQIRAELPTSVRSTAADGRVFVMLSTAKESRAAPAHSRLLVQPRRSLARTSIP